MLLDPIREVDWATQNDQVLIKELKTQANQDAFILQHQGGESEPCQQCLNSCSTF
jgi:hypothetical protein